MKIYFYFFFSLGAFLLPSFTDPLSLAPQKKFPLDKNQKEKQKQQKKKNNEEQKPKTKQICFYEKERRLLVLALNNESQDPLLDHLASNLAPIIAARLRSLAYASVEKTRALLCLRTELDLDEKGKGYTRYYSREKESSQQKESDWDNKKQNRVQLVVKHKSIALPFQKNADNRKFLKTAEDFQTEYLLAGRLLLNKSKKNGSPKNGLRYEFRFIDSIHNRSYDFSIALSRDRPYEKLDLIVNKIQEILWAKKAVLVSFQTSQPGAMLYLNEHYMGRTPLSRKVLAGKYKLGLVQEGRQKLNRSIAIAPDGQRHFQIRMREQKGKGAIDIKSEPPGASVYLNLDPLGKTPLQVDGLTSGKHRLRLSKEGHVDIYLGVQIEADKTKKLKLSMRPGDTLSYYKNLQYAIGELTYSDLGLYTSISSAFFYAGWLHFRSQARNAQEESSAVESQGENSNARSNYQYARVSAALSIVSLLSAGYFYYKALRLNSYFGEISASLPAKAPESFSVRKTGSSSLNIESGCIGISGRARQFVKQKTYETSICIPF